jgi:hypothetical protein
MRMSNHRASLAVLVGLVATVAVPGAILFSRQTHGIVLLDAAWAIPVAAVCGVAALLFVRGARGRIRQTLERAGGSGRIRTAKILAIAGICFALSGSIAVGVYELLLRLEK